MPESGGYRYDSMVWSPWACWRQQMSWNAWVCKLQMIFISTTKWPQSSSVQPCSDSLVSSLLCFQRSNRTFSYSTPFLWNLRGNWRSAMSQPEKPKSALVATVIIVQLWHQGPMLGIICKHQSFVFWLLIFKKKKNQNPKTKNKNTTWWQSSDLNTDPKALEV